MAKPKHQYSKSDAWASAEILQNLMSRVIDSEKPLFRGFKLRQDARYAELLKEAHGFYMNGKFTQAKTTFDKAHESLVYVLKIYFQGTVEHFFSPMANALIEAGLPEDLRNRVNNHIGRVSTYASRFDAINLIEASDLYWGVLEVIQVAEAEAKTRKASQERRAQEAAETAEAQAKALKADQERQAQEAVAIKAEAQRETQRLQAAAQVKKREEEIQSLFGNTLLLA